MELRGAKARFCLREKFYKRVHEICFELTKQISVILRENPPLRDDVASAACFLSLRHMEHAFDKCRKFTLSAEALRQIGGKIQKCDFGFFERFFWVHENLGELTPAIFRDLEGSALCGALF